MDVPLPTEKWGRWKTFILSEPNIVEIKNKTAIKVNMMTLNRRPTLQNIQSKTIKLKKIKPEV